jgi:hypothetical protein
MNRVLRIASTGEVEAIEIPGESGVRQLFPGCSIRGKTLQQIDEFRCIREWRPCNESNPRFRIIDAYDARTLHPIDLPQGYTHVSSSLTTNSVEVL